jgi:hypothetical protein
MYGRKCHTFKVTSSTSIVKLLDAEVHAMGFCRLHDHNVTWSWSLSGAEGNFKVLLGEFNQQ